MIYTDKINTISAIVCLIVVIISIPYVLLTSVLLGAMISEPTMMALFFTGSFIGAGIIVIYYIFTSINKKSIIYSKKGQKINVKAYIFIEAVINLIIMGMSVGFLGITAIPWMICVIFNLLAGFLYQNYH